MQAADYLKFDEIRQELLNHPIYKEVNTPEKVRIFMKHHVFAVWDFMSLLKRLQQEVTSVSVPWKPYLNPSYTRFINEIVLAEESDEDGQGGYASHFQLYIDAMKQSGADTIPINQFLGELQKGISYEEAIKNEMIPRSVADFVHFNLELALKGEIHEVASAFFYGREDLIPDMFESLLDSLSREGAKYDRLNYYLNRHIELDGDHHGPLAQKLLDDLCGEDDQKKVEAILIANRSLESRKKLWDGILKEIRENGIE
jgi:hypothetical protein